MFHISRIKYSWYGKQEDYLLITIGTKGATPELWGRWFKQDYKKGKLMNDELMETALVQPDKIRDSIAKQAAKEKAQEQEADTNTTDRA